MYKYKDILFALITEYEKNQEELRKLSEFVRLKVSGKIDFYLEKEENDKLCELYYSISKKNAFLRNVLTGLVSPNTGIVYSSLNQVFSGDTKDFEVENNEAFKETFDRIMANPFTKEAFNTTVEVLTDDKKKIQILPDRIITNARNVSSIYVPEDDLVKFRGDGMGYLTYRKLYDFMDMEIPKDRFPIYLQELIESSSVLEKPVAFYDDGKVNYRKEFTPVEEEKRLVLVNRRVNQ